jgi:endonuclease/exonuclease/phosphatase family metal-dependent hydrolase
MNVLTYNVGWESMENIKQRNNVKNIIQTLIENDISLIGIQETGKLEDDLNFKNYHCIHSYLDKETPMASILFNKTQFILKEKGEHIIVKGDDKRPLIYVILKERKTKVNILFINLHNCHGLHIQPTFDSLNLKLNYEKIIICGDFNRKIPKLTFNTFPLEISTIGPTCCDLTYSGKAMHAIFDAVLSYGFSIKDIVTLVSQKKNKNLSDHLPVLVIFEFP